MQNMKEYKIRLEEPADWQEVENLTREAFWNVYRPGCLEHFVLNRYRSNPDFIPELDFVMEADGRIIGHVMYSHAELCSDEGDRLAAWTLGPISIHPDWKRKGYGLALLRYSLEKAREMGIGVLCFEGNIDFYGNAGFVLASSLGIHYYEEPKDDPVPYFLAQELIPGYLDGITGGDFKIGTEIMGNPGDAKYGMTKPQMFQAYRLLKEKGVKEFGIHAFLASNTTTNDYWPTLAMQLFRLAVELKNDVDVHIGFINLSGGVGIPYRPDQQAADILEIGEKVRRVYEQILVPAGMGDVAIYTELGRFMLAPYGHLVATAIHEKHTHKEYIGLAANDTVATQRPTRLVGPAHGLSRACAS